jgi:cytidyltransferase-like protein
MSKALAVVGAFDNLRSQDVRLLEEASQMGPVTAWAISDELIERDSGKAPKFPLPERLYLLRALRFVTEAIALEAPIGADGDRENPLFKPSVWVDTTGPLNQERRGWCHKRGVDYRVLDVDQLAGFPQPPVPPSPTGRKKVVVTGCYDWFHSGHVRFFEEVSSYGNLYVVVGHDANIRLLKGEGHPLVPQDERRYMVGAVRYVTQALISSGEGWLDAEPEMQKIRPDTYAVNEDGDRGGKREFCTKRGIEYLVLKRTPAPGLPARSSTDLRGF